MQTLLYPVDKYTEDSYTLLAVSNPTNPLFGSDQTRLTVHTKTREKAVGC